MCLSVPSIARLERAGRRNAKQAHEYRTCLALKNTGPVGTAKELRLPRTSLFITNDMEILLEPARETHACPLHST